MQYHTPGVIPAAVASLLFAASGTAMHVCSYMRRTFACYQGWINLRKPPCPLHNVSDMHTRYSSTPPCLPGYPGTRGTAPGSTSNHGVPRAAAHGRCQPTFSEGTYKNVYIVIHARYNFTLLVGGTTSANLRIRCASVVPTALPVGYRRYCLRLTCFCSSLPCQVPCTLLKSCPFPDFMSSL